MAQANHLFKASHAALCLLKFGDNLGEVADAADNSSLFVKDVSQVFNNLSGFLDFLRAGIF